MLLSRRYRLLCGLLRLLVRCGIDERDLEAVVLRRQLKILARGGRRPRFTTADRAFLAAGSPVALPGPAKELPGRPGHPPPMAPRALKEASSRPVPPARSSSPRSLDQGADPSVGSGEPQVGIPPQDPGRTLEARDRRLAHHRRHGASPKRPRPGTTSDRPDLDRVPPAGVRPALRQLPIRPGRQPGGRRIGSAGSNDPGRRGPSHDRA
jgi:hypothetical protein